MNKFTKGFAVLASVAILSACGGKSGIMGDSDSGADSGSASSSGMYGGGDFDGHPLDNPAGMLSKRTVYFAFDSSEVKYDDRETIAAHASYLSNNPGARVTLEGHADERGSREYNIGLGERRANAVRKLMTLQGAASSQLETVSYGEERPADSDHNESAWSKNRRVEIIYTRR